jgi:Cu/Ag efflux pump CusA
MEGEVIVMETPGRTPNRDSRRPQLASGPIAVGVAVAGLTLAVYEWVLFATGIPVRMFFMIAALFVAQSVFNGVVLACFVGDANEADAAQPAGFRSRALRQVSAVLVGALFAMSGVLPFAFAWGTGEKISETAETLAIGGLLAATVLAIVVAPLLYALTVRRGKDRRASP